jgi:decaprenylphospho-beta-D-erythro-pentofuranosid-2-ulose 2-reductase
VNNAVSQPQTVVVLGGASEIGRAIVEALVSPALREVVLAVRRPDEFVAPTFGDANVRCVEFDADRPETHAAVVAAIVDEVGDLDVVVQAFGRLGPADTPDPVTAAGLVTTNFAGAVSSGLAVAEQLRRQGHGTLVVLSSVAGVRTRPSNFVYGSTKAGQDAFATGLGHALRGTGAHVLTVRPGFVRTAMTDGMAEAPFAADPADVANAVVAGLRRRRDVVWAPGVLQAVFAVLRIVPGFVWRRLDR